jgi:SAM-dependent methyltransferase
MSIDTDRDFGRRIAEVYESHLVPLIFQPYAVEFAQRLAGMRDARLLEIAAGTGVVTRALASALPRSVAITATDLNQAMLDRAIALGTSRRVEWKRADVMALPFDDATFDVVVCQFGVMFFPDKPAAFAEARRVLRPGGRFLFSVWDRIEENEFADSVTTSVGSIFGDDAVSFLRRIPHGYFDHSRIVQDLVDGGFVSQPGISTVAARSIADVPETAAIAYCEGTPLRNEIEARDASGLSRATAAAAAALRMQSGPGPIDGKIQAHIVSVVR